MPSLVGISLEMAAAPLHPHQPAPFSRKDWIFYEPTAIFGDTPTHMWRGGWSPGSPFMGLPSAVHYCSRFNNAAIRSMPVVAMNIQTCVSATLGIFFLFLFYMGELPASTHFVSQFQRPKVSLVQPLQPSSW